MTIWKYTLARIGLIAVFLGIFYLLGMRSYLLFFAAIICGFMVSFLFLQKTGDAAASDVERLMNRAPRRADDEAEDRELGD